MNKNPLKMLVQSAVVTAAFTLTLSAQPDPSDATAECLICHEMATPGIVFDWQRSRHANITPSEALKADPINRRVSALAFAKNVRDTSIGCFECHGINTANHADSFEHFGYYINKVVSPKDCSTCHPLERAQFDSSKKGHAIANLRDNPVYHQFETEVIGMKTVGKNGISSQEPSAHTTGEACYACHGTVVEVKGFEVIDTDLGEVEVPILTNWPNQGVGRINPDGSRGACTACHPRHGFSIEIARKPYTCAQCHVEPDVPAWDVWKESKHGNITLSEGSHYDWSAVPWKVGQDFKTPSCAVCHVSLITDPMDDVIAQRTHNFGDRLWVRIFGLPTSHPQPKHGLTTTLRNSDGLPMPVNFKGEPAAEGLISSEEMASRQATMSSVCGSCHSTSWVIGHFEQFDAAIAEIDEMVIETTALMLEAWEAGLVDQENLFDEPLEHLWVNQWLINASAARYATAMNGQDYAAFKYGWWGLSQSLAKIHEKVKTE